MQSTPEKHQAQGISFLQISPEKLHKLLTGLESLCWNFEAEDYEVKAKQIRNAFKNNPNATKHQQEDFKWLNELTIESVHAIMEIREIVLSYNKSLKSNKAA